MYILSPPLRNKGASLIEVLVSIVILSFGLLGLAGFQLLGITGNNVSTMRTIATLQAYDMSDRMRLNATGVTNRFYDDISGVGVNSGCNGSICTPGDIASFDTFQWNAANAALLPSGKGTVKRAAGNVWTITISWDDSKGQKPVRTFVVRFEP